MLKLAAFASLGLLIAAITSTDIGASDTPLAACDVSSRSEAIRWNMANPGVSAAAACRASTGI